MQDNDIVKAIKLKKEQMQNRTFFEKAGDLAASMKLYCWDYFVNPEHYDQMILAEKFLKLYDEQYELWRQEVDKRQEIRKHYNFQ
jgi:hypothetical protein